MIPQTSNNFRVINKIGELNSIFAHGNRLILMQWIQGSFELIFGFIYCFIFHCIMTSGRLRRVFLFSNERHRGQNIQYTYHEPIWTGYLCVYVFSVRHWNNQINHVTRWSLISSNTAADCQVSTHSTWHHSEWQLGLCHSLWISSSLKVKTQRLKGDSFIAPLNEVKVKKFNQCCLSLVRLYKGGQSHALLPVNVAINTALETRTASLDWPNKIWLSVT